MFCELTKAPAINLFNVYGRFCTTQRTNVKFSSLKKFQEQLQSAGSDVSSQLQQNFDAQVSALAAEHQVSDSISSPEMKKSIAKDPS
jgi:hypothetical protein